MPNRFSLNDGTVAVVIGSGAGGGTLGYELARKGIRTVILEAGPRIEAQEHIDDEVASNEQLSWLDKRTTSGTWALLRTIRTLQLGCARRWVALRSAGPVVLCDSRRTSSGPGMSMATL